MIITVILKDMTQIYWGSAIVSFLTVVLICCLIIQKNKSDRLEEKQKEIKRNQLLYPDLPTYIVCVTDGYFRGDNENVQSYIIPSEIDHTHFVDLIIDFFNKTGGEVRRRASEIVAIKDLRTFSIEIKSWELSEIDFAYKCKLSVKKVS